MNIIDYNFSFSHILDGIRPSYYKATTKVVTFGEYNHISINSEVYWDDIERTPKALTKVLDTRNNYENQPEEFCAYYTSKDSLKKTHWELYSKIVKECKSKQNNSSTEYFGLDEVTRLINESNSDLFEDISGLRAELNDFKTRVYNNSANISLLIHDTSKLKEDIKNEPTVSFSAKGISSIGEGVVKDAVVHIPEYKITTGTLYSQHNEDKNKSVNMSDLVIQMEDILSEMSKIIEKEEDEEQEDTKINLDLKTLSESLGDLYLW